MRYQDPEVHYARFIEHAHTCGVRGPAGGEGGADNEMCLTGRILLKAWGEAERAYAEVEYAASRAEERRDMGVEG